MIIFNDEIMEKLGKNFIRKMTMKITDCQGILMQNTKKKKKKNRFYLCVRKQMKNGQQRTVLQLPVAVHCTGQEA